MLVAILTQCGYTSSEYDVSAAVGVTVDGFTLTSTGQAAEVLRPLLTAYSFDLPEIDGKLVAVRRGGLPKARLSARHLGVRRWENSGVDESGPPPGSLKTTVEQPLELPFGVVVSYFNLDKEYEQGTQRDIRYTKPENFSLVTVNTNLALSDDDARHVAGKILYDLWVAQHHYEFTTGWKYLAYTPTDVLEVPDGPDLLRVRVVSCDVAIWGLVAFSAVRDDLNTLTQLAPGGVSVPPAESFVSSVFTLALWSDNALRDADADTIGLYAAVAPTDGGTFPGVALYWSRDGGASYDPLADLTDAAPIGTADTALPAFTTTGLWDETSTLDVTLAYGELATASEAQVLNGANALRVGQEVILFQVATVIGANQYRLSRLLRGRRGTNAYWSEHVIGEPVVALAEGWVTRVELADSLYNKTILVKPVGEGDDITAVAPVSLLVTGNERKPYSPCHLRGALDDASGEISLTWIRRTRKGGQMRDGGDVPLSEAREEYAIEIWDVGGTTLMRAATGLVEPLYVYTLDDQLLDFGEPCPGLLLRVWQIGAYGRGYEAQETFIFNPNAFTGLGGTFDFSDADNSALYPIFFG